MRVVAIADEHIGGFMSLANPSTTPSKDAYAPVRGAIYDRWKAATEGKWSKPDVLILNGDVVEGKNRKGGGMGLWTADLQEQADHAVELIEMWGAKKIYVIRGSRYHVAAGDSGLLIEEQIARDLKAEVYPNQENIPARRRDRSGWQWYLNLDGVTFHVSHKVGFSRVFHYRTTPLSRELLQARLNDLLRHEMKNMRIRVVLRAHAHYYLTVGHSGSDGFILPCWKTQDDWMLEKGPLDITPDLGFVGFEVNKGVMNYEKNLFQINDVQKPPLTIVGRGRKTTRKSSSRGGVGKVAKRKSR